MISFLSLIFSKIGGFIKGIYQWIQKWFPWLLVCCIVLGFTVSAFTNQAKIDKQIENHRIVSKAQQTQRMDELAEKVFGKKSAN
jgi:uncharacterized membrane protein